MKKLIVFFTFLCTGLTLKPMNEKPPYKLVKKCFGLEVYKINNLDDDIHCTIRFFTKKIEKLNKFNTEINEENSFQNALKFGSYGPIAVISPKQLETYLSGIKITNYLRDTKYSLNQRAKSKEKLEKKAKHATVQTFLETLRNSLKYYDLKKQEKILQTKHHRNWHTNSNSPNPEIKQLKKMSSYISSSITNYTNSVAQIIWKEKIKENGETIAKILGEDKNSDEAQGANDSEEEKEKEEEEHESLLDMMKIIAFPLRYREDGYDSDDNDKNQYRYEKGNYEYEGMPGMLKIIAYYLAKITSFLEKKK